jgi:hypothetical protein
MRILIAAAFLLVVQTAFAAGEYPGYGVVQSVIPLSPKAKEPSASAGASAPSRSRQVRTWLVKVKMDDGRYQVRQVKRVAPAVGQRVLITNAGDVVGE